jgi:predicted RND superfamily exporter protein
MKIDKMGVVVLMSHLTVTLAILAVYALFAYLGKPLTTIENMLLIIVGWWFGAISKESLKKQPDKTEEEELRPKEA